jgi:hypothetical protein
MSVKGPVGAVYPPAGQVAPGLGKHAWARPAGERQRGASGMAVFWRFVSEFWFALVLALVWAILRDWPFRAEWSWVGAFVTNLGGAFFLVSYFTGQYVRIKRQHTNEQTLATLMEQLGGVKSTVDELTTKATDFVAREPALQSVAKELLHLASNANTQLAQANRTAGVWLDSMPWLSDTPLPLRVSNAAALEPISTWVPKPPDKPSAKGPS